MLPFGAQSDKDTREDIMKVFNLFDDDGSGRISLRNLKRVAKELGETMTGACEGAEDGVQGPATLSPHRLRATPASSFLAPQRRSCWR